MSVSLIQRKIVEEEIARYYLSLGLEPRAIDIARDMSLFFSENPIGLPFQVSDDRIFSGSTSDVDIINDNILKASLNIVTVMEAIKSDVSRSMGINTAIKDRLRMLMARQARLSDEIDDYLLASNNTNGYFYSYTNRFHSNSLIDLDYTTAYVDNSGSKVLIPHIAVGSTMIPQKSVHLIQATAYVDGKKKAYDVISPFENATDGLSNTAWQVQVSADKQTSVLFEVTIGIPRSQSSNTISQIDIEPFTTSPVTISATANIDTVKTRFGNIVTISSGKASFIDKANDIDSITIVMSKDKYDRVVNINNSSRYIYVFGANELAIVRKLYDNSAILVSKPISLPAEISSSHTIDKVRLEVSDSVPDGTNIDYYLARDNASAVSVSDFSWHYLDPKSKNEDLKVFGFGGSEDITMDVVDSPGPNELQLIALNSSSLDLSLKNPSTSIITGSSIYRIMEFKDSFIQNSLSLEEGINTTRILSIPLDTLALDGLSFWKDYVNKNATAEEAYGLINDGHSFFYGGDVGANGKSVYVETFLASDLDHPTISKEFKKLDNNSKLWDIKVYLNGSEVAYLPVGTDHAIIPWKFNQGDNHVAVVVNIPEASATNSSPYLGSIDLMNGSKLSSWGTLRLAKWSYIDFFHMEHNDTGRAKTFTIYNGEIVSRKIPTTNFRLRYSKSTESGPSSVRLKAELSRNQDADTVSPSISMYSMKFSYGSRR